MAKHDKLIFNEFEPKKEFEKIIESYWEFIYCYNKDSYSNPSIFPNTSTLIIYFRDYTENKNELWLAGPCTKSIKLPVSTNCYYFVVEFKPLLVKLLFKYNGPLPVNKIKDASATIIDNKTKLYLLQKLSYLHTSNEIISVFEIFLRDLALTVTNPDNDITKAINILQKTNGNEKLENIFKNISIGKRQFQRNFLRETGITLKEFARIIRVRSAADKIVEGGLEPSEIIYESGFYDQSHYYKEFKIFSGVNPTIFAERQKRLTHQSK
jgi:AraC-like DNA-binding protein